jgi:hypothetical protein
VTGAADGGALGCRLAGMLLEQGGAAMLDRSSYGRALPLAGTEVGG